MNTHQWYMMGLVSVQPPNTFIGGVAASLSTPSLLASKLGISVGRIENFTIVGADIQCRITGGGYVIPLLAFSGDTSITHYTDSDNLVTDIGTEAFKDVTQMTELDFKGVVTLTGTAIARTSSVNKVSLENCTSITGTAFSSSTNIKTFYIPRCASLGVTNGNDLVFELSASTDSKLYIPASLQTSNSGGVEGDVAYFVANGGDARFVTNFTAPLQPTIVNTSTVYNTAIKVIDPATSTNSIDYYEVSVNGGAVSNISVNSYIAGLSPNTSYSNTLIAVDVFYNKSIISSPINITTLNTMTDVDAIAFVVASKNNLYESPINTVYASLKSNSLYTRVQTFYPNIGTAEQQKYNGKNPLNTDEAFRQTYTGTGIFSEFGVTGNTANFHSNTHFIPSANQNVNSNGMTVVVGTNGVATSVFEVGSRSAGDHYVCARYDNASGFISRMNGNRIDAPFNANAKGIFTSTKQSATVTSLFRSGVKVATGNSGGVLSTLAVYINAVNDSGTVTGRSDKRVQSVWFHEGFSDVDTVTFQTIIDTFENALGRKTW